MVEVGVRNYLSICQSILQFFCVVGQDFNISIALKDQNRTGDFFCILKGIDLQMIPEVLACEA